MTDEVKEVVEGDGYAVANVDALGEGRASARCGARSGVTAFGVNAIELPPGSRRAATSTTTRRSSTSSTAAASR